MSTFFKDMRLALEARLNSLSGNTPIAWENAKFTQPKTVYLQPFFIPAGTTQASLGDAGKDITDGIFQVSVHIPKSTGTSDLPDQIADHFKRGTVLTKNNVTIRIVSASVEQAVNDDNFHTVPVTIRWQTFTNARQS